jgi:glutamate-1-semialdehyde 2,1-aminomutase
MPKWQFTLSATQANTEVIRLARRATGRETILMFDGKYHGHGDATLVVLEDGTVLPEQQGLPRAVTDHARIVQFNDVDALELALAPRRRSAGDRSRNLAWLAEQTAGEGR